MPDQTRVANLHTKAVLGSYRTRDGTGRVPRRWTSAGVGVYTEPERTDAMADTETARPDRIDTVDKTPAAGAALP